jgi:para-aminobenzoate synthetase component 1
MTKAPSIPRAEPFAFFLDSGMDPAKLGRYPFIGSDPLLVVKTCSDELTLLSAGREERRRGNPFGVEGERYPTPYTVD